MVWNKSAIVLSVVFLSNGTLSFINISSLFNLKVVARHRLLTLVGLYKWVIPQQAFNDIFSIKIEMEFQGTRRLKKKNLHQNKHLYKLLG